MKVCASSWSCAVVRASARAFVLNVAWAARASAREMRCNGIRHVSASHSASASRLSVVVRVMRWMSSTCCNSPALESFNASSVACTHDIDVRNLCTRQAVHVHTLRTTHRQVAQHVQSPAALSKPHKGGSAVHCELRIDFGKFAVFTAVVFELPHCHQNPAH